MDQLISSRSIPDYFDQQLMDLAGSIEEESAKLDQIAEKLFASPMKMRRCIKFTEKTLATSLKMKHITTPLCSKLFRNNALTEVI